MTRRPKTLNTTELSLIIQRYDIGHGFTDAVKAFASTLPVAERTVWYWLAGRKVHPALAARIRSLKP